MSATREATALARALLAVIESTERRCAELERECARLGEANNELCDEVYRLEQILRAHGVDPSKEAA